MKTLLRIIDALFSEPLNSVICWIFIWIAAAWLAINIGSILINRIIE